MTNFDLVLRGGAAILPEHGRTACDIAVRDGRIAAIVATGGQLAAATEISVRGLTVFPGALDVHLHLGHGKDIAQPRVPLDADRETAAAAKGGVTCFIPYLMATEPFENIFEDVVSVTQSGARIDFSYHFIISTEEQLAGVPVYVRNYGVPTFKIFMNNRGGEGARLGLPDIDDGFLFRLCEAAAGSGGMCAPIRKRSRLPGCCAIGSSLRIRMARAGLRLGMQRGRRLSRPMRFSAQRISRALSAHRSMSCTRPRNRRSLPHCAIAATVLRFISRPVRIT